MLKILALLAALALPASAQTKDRASIRKELAEARALLAAVEAKPDDYENVSETIRTLKETIAMLEKAEKAGTQPKRVVSGQIKASTSLKMPAAAPETKLEEEPARGAPAAGPETEPQASGGGVETVLIKKLVRDFDEMDGDQQAKVRSGFRSGAVIGAAVGFVGGVGIALVAPGPQGLAVGVAFAVISGGTGAYIGATGAAKNARMGADIGTMTR